MSSGEYTRLRNAAAQTKNLYVEALNRCSVLQCSVFTARPNGSNESDGLRQALGM